MVATFYSLADMVTKTCHRHNWNWLNSLWYLSYIAELQQMTYYMQQWSLGDSLPELFILWQMQLH